MFNFRRNSAPRLSERFEPYQLQINEFLHGFTDGSLGRKDPVISVWLTAESIEGTLDQTSHRISMN